jgi:1-acyl-sn-glycerol-3-phosphate acyltransferase
LSLFESDLHRVKHKTEPTVDRGTWTGRVLRAFNRVYARTYHEIDNQVPLKLPATGPAILVCNHISGLDPLLLQSAVSRPIIWMMAKEYYEMKALKWLYEAVEAIPVERNGRDSSATRAALRALANGRVLGIFPEGRIETSHELLPFQTGVAMMASRANVPVFPGYLDGTNRGQDMVSAFITMNSIKLRFGPKINLISPPEGEKPDLDKQTEQIRTAISTLKSETA